MQPNPAVIIRCRPRMTGELLLVTFPRVSPGFYQLSISGLVKGSGQSAVTTDTHVGQAVVTHHTILLGEARHIKRLTIR